MAKSTGHSSGTERRLAAIMFTDIVGYTALMAESEEKGLRARALHRSIVTALVPQFDGEVVDATGDESLSVFPNAVRAADCAQAIQRDVGNEEGLSVRIGIHTGDIVQKDGEVVGAAVNIAARVRPFAEPGGICITDAVRQAIRGFPHLRTQRMGPRSLKNVEGEVGLCSLETSDAAKRPWWRRTITAAVWVPVWGLLLVGVVAVASALYVLVW